jgi:hypothetical protein
VNETPQGFDADPDPDPDPTFAQFEIGTNATVFLLCTVKFFLLYTAFAISKYILLKLSCHTVHIT